ncbi:AAA family ATPase [Stutzerimonas stutzeri]|uniref:AAA family ATPase n=1 Tax=Stutzerimonas stutzeri TaxID=316 RepID=UPI003DA159CC
MEGKFVYRILLESDYNKTPPPDCIFLSPSSWDDYYFKTTFSVSVHCQGSVLRLGEVKIGYEDQPAGWTRDALKDSDLLGLPKNFFSIGQDVAYYETLYENFSPNEIDRILTSMRDASWIDAVLRQSQKHEVFRHSLLRTVSLAAFPQYKRITRGLPPLTAYKFSYNYSKENDAKIALDFNVRPGSVPPTNIHVLIGRNGAGKTTILNSMVSNVVNNTHDIDRGFLVKTSGAYSKMPDQYFSSVVSVSFSAFDTFMPPDNRQDRSEGVAYFYIGMKRRFVSDNGKVSAIAKVPSDFLADTLESIKSCWSQERKRNRWIAAIKRLESDLNFAEMNLAELSSQPFDWVKNKIIESIESASSGHFIILHTITHLVDVVEEKTLVLMDEPETHLHPPLLSAFMRALADLLVDRNAIALIATHSPVVLQEVPKSCVFVLTRNGSQQRIDQPERETFGENVGALTKSVFGLEVVKSGFHDILTGSVQSGRSFEEILSDYSGQLGLEGQLILRAMLELKNEPGTE